MEKRTDKIQMNILRQSVLNWYEFRKDADLLEIGAGEGILTELFAGRCRTVTALMFTDEEERLLRKRCGGLDNVRVIREWPEENGRSFDYVVCLEEAEKQKDPASAVHRWLSYLRSGGVLLLGADNRYGLRNFCGYREKYSGMPFYGVNGYAPELAEAFGGDGLPSLEGRTYNRAEWSRYLRDAGAGKFRFYYPVPDGRMPQFIFTDNWNNGINAAERLIDYDYEDPAMTGVEHRIFRDMIDAGALPFMANSFLMEVTQTGSLSDIDYAVVTTDRGPERGMATTVRASGRVYKRPLWNEGAERLKELHALTEELAGKGVPVVKTCLETDEAGLYLDMPCIRQEGLSAVLERFADGDPARFLAIFDDIWDNIRRSSDTEKGKKGRVFLDLAPCNCFYGGTDGHGRLLFYDQEFVSDSSTPEFAMFRTLKYFFASSPASRRRFDLKEMLKRYGITEDMAAEFEEEEAAFILSVRHADDFAPLYRTATPSYGRISRNMAALAEQKKKPYRVGYVPGVFDLFHTGHLRLLERCRERCEYLIVGVLTDELAEYYKGKRPVISCENRMRVIGGLRCVDRVIPVTFENTDKIKAWEQLHYDCHFSGDDHVGHWNDVMEELRKRGSDMEFFSYTEGISSTSIREKL